MEETWTHGVERFSSVGHTAAPGWHRNPPLPLFFSDPSAKDLLEAGSLTFANLPVSLSVLVPDCLAA